MALNLSTLTSPATSGDVLAEALTTADFLESCPVLRNLARGSNKGGDAEQAVALNQPRALPLTKDADGVLGGYCYLPNVLGNAPAVTFPTIGANDDFVLEMDVYIVETNGCYLVTGVNAASRFFVTDSLFLFSGTASAALSSALSEGPSTIRIERTSGSISLYQNNVLKSTPTTDSSTYSFTHLSFNGQFSSGIPPLNGYIKTATLSIEGTEQLNIDFTSPNVRHGDTKFTCSTGQVVTINQSGNDPATIIKKPVLRFDGVDDFMDGVFGQTLSSGHLFAAFSVLGDGGSWQRLFSTNPTGGDDASGSMMIRRNSTEDAFRVRYDSAGSIIHDGMYDSARGDMLLDVKITNGEQNSFINNADEENKTLSGTVGVDDFVLAARKAGDFNMPIDLEYLALFDASITDAQADAVRNYINNRNNVFDLKDGFGYYFYDAQKAPVGNISSGSASWNGRIVGSDNGDTDKYATQGVSNDQPVSDGYVVTFADNTDHLDIPSTTQAGWQVVGTSLGTFAYRVNANAVTELNLLGNLGNASYRKAGDLYGIILLPESATGREIEQARKLLIDRGAADGTTSGSIFTNWFDRYDIVEFKPINTSSVTYLDSAFNGCSSLVSFPALDFSNGTSFASTWINNTSLLSFNTTEMSKGTNFAAAWRNCSSLTSFPADAKLGTEANNVNFTSAWRDSGLTSFSTPLPTATNAFETFRGCTSLTSFSSDLPSATYVYRTWRECTSLTSFSSEIPLATNVYQAWYGCSSLSDFRTTDIKNCTDFTSAWQNCSSLTQFPEDAKLGTEATNVNFTNAWRDSGLTSFSTPLPTAAYVSSAWRISSLASFNAPLPSVINASHAWRQSGLTSFRVSLSTVTNVPYAWLDCTSLTDFSADVFANWNPSSITSGVFNDTWDGCTSLTAQSVENILTSIDASGKHATATGASGGTALADAGIDIDYNVATGSLSAATTAAIDSLSGKGWQVYINGELVIPNILDLAPAAAYSLRSFDADADPNVVNVRRSSDGATSDFTASEVSDGTLRDWTLGDTLALDGQRMYFDGVNDKVAVSGVDISSYSEITIKTRFLWNNGIDANEGIFTNGSTSADRFGLYVSSQLTFYVGDGSSTFYPSLVPLNENQYYTVVATAKVENGQMTANIFIEGLIDGTENSISTSATDFSVVAQNWVIGYLNVNRYFEGLIDYVDVYEGYSTDGSVTGMTQLHGWSNTNITDASWTDSVGSANGTVSGTPALFSGQGFDGHVTTWYDQGGTNHAAQATASSQPKIVDGGTLVTEGGLAALDFDGTDDHLNFASSITTKALFCVTSPVQSINDELILSDGAGGGTGKHFGFNDGVNLREYPDYSPGYTHGLSSNEQSLVSATILSGNKDYYVNSSTVGASSGTALPSYNMIGIPSGLQNFEGNAQEIVIYDSDQSANRTAIENNINDHFNIYS